MKLRSRCPDFDSDDIQKLIFCRIVAKSDFRMGSQKIEKGERGMVIYGIAPLPPGKEDPLTEFGPRIPKVLVIWDNPSVQSTSFRKPEFEQFLKVRVN